MALKNVFSLSLTRPHFLIILTVGILLTMHIPFLLSDPDINISGSRDANTDEGLNTSQVRNYINHGDLTFTKSDNFVKTPLFGAILYLPFKLLGTNLLVGRLSILLFSLGICLFIYWNNKTFEFFGLSSLIVVFSEYYIFHYFHYCMAEILSTVLIFLSIYLLVKQYKTQAVFRSALLSATCVSLAYYIKIQFLYSVLILPFILILFTLFNIYERKLLVKQLAYTILFSGIYLLAYFLIWYLPNKSFFEYVMADQTNNRFADFSSWPDQLNFYLKYLFYNEYLKIFTWSFYILYAIGLVRCFFTTSTAFRAFFIALSTWILIEFHKLPMTYLPTRYTISLLFPVGLVMALVLNELLTIKGKTPPIIFIKILSLCFLISFGVKNFKDYVISYKNRTHSILEINNYLARYTVNNKPVMGAWAPSLTWQSKALSFPVWRGYFNDSNVIETFAPAIIIAETEEQDSDHAYSAAGITLDEHADSIKFFTINQWKIKILWIKPAAIP